MRVLRVLVVLVAGVLAREATLAVENLAFPRLCNLLAAHTLGLRVSTGTIRHSAVAFGGEKVQTDRARSPRKPLAVQELVVDGFGAVGGGWTWLG